MHQFIITTITKWNQNIFFKFISSVKLAVPVMIALIIAVSVGTVLESMHNAEYAKLALYNATWFNALLSLLGLNVFASMMSRYPWKFYQMGFVMTHIGIIIVLIGSWITKIYGVDGSLQVQEGQSQNMVTLPRLMVGYQFDGSSTLSSVIFDKTLFEKSENQLDFINEKIGHVVKVERFVPFAEIEKGFTTNQDISGPVGISFGLKSQFFDVKEWLHSEENPVFQMGPATLKLIIDDSDSPQDSIKLAPIKKKKEKAQGPGLQTRDIAQVENTLVVLDQKNGKELRKLSLAELKKGILQNGVSIKLVKSYSRAIVAENKMVENEDPAGAPNPALELSIEKGSEKVREVLYGKFPGFSLNKDGVFGLSFKYLAGVETSETVLPSGHPRIDGPTSPTGTADGPSPMQAAASSITPGENIIEFHANRKSPSQVRIVLIKKGEKIAEKTMKEGDIFQTPWMGMQLFIGAINFGSEKQVDVRAVRPKPGKNLPPSAVFVKPLGQEKGVWLSQGEVKNFSVSGRSGYVVFANESVQLPFEVKLDKFTKKDYPGTETPYSYESLVTHSRTNEQTLISMNEPLKSDGYTLYQASYALNPGQAPVSILSVNQDPGRAVKYLGSLMLCLGIATFTLMRSRVYKNRQNRKSI